MSAMTIGRLAKQSGVNIDTIRYYERNRLLPEPSRRLSGYREYGPTDVARLRFIMRAKDLGFTLAEIAELIVALVLLGKCSSSEHAQTSGDSCAPAAGAEDGAQDRVGGCLRTSNSLGTGA